MTTGDWENGPTMGAPSSSAAFTGGEESVGTDAGLSHTALGQLAAGAVANTLEVLLKKISTAAFNETLQVPAGELPDWREDTDTEDPGSPSWMGYLRSAVREATEAALMDSMAVDQDWNAPPPTLLYPNCVEWVQGWLLPTYRRGVPATGETSTWCPQWWDHTEAVVRLSALWRGFEQHRIEAGDSFSGWLRDHLDHHMSVLLSSRGPFEHCTIGEGHNTARALKPLPMVDPPVGLATFLG